MGPRQRELELRRSRRRLRPAKEWLARTAAAIRAADDGALVTTRAAHGGPRRGSPARTRRSCRPLAISCRCTATRSMPRGRMGPLDVHVLPFLARMTRWLGADEMCCSASSGFRRAAPAARRETVSWSTRMRRRSTRHRLSRHFETQAVLARCSGATPTTSGRDGRAPRSMSPAMSARSGSGALTARRSLRLRRSRHSPELHGAPPTTATRGLTFALQTLCSTRPGSYLGCMAAIEGERPRRLLPVRRAAHREGRRGARWQDRSSCPRRRSTDAPRRSPRRGRGRTGTRRSERRPFARSPRSGARIQLGSRRRTRVGSFRSSSARPTR